MMPRRLAAHRRSGWRGGTRKGGASGQIAQAFQGRGSRTDLYGADGVADAGAMRITFRVGPDEESGQKHNERWNHEEEHD